MTKQMESYGTSGISVVLNFISPAYSPETLMSIFDCLVETGLSVCSYAKKNGMDYEILYYDRNEQKRRYNPLICMIIGINGLVTHNNHGSWDL